MNTHYTFVTIGSKGCSGYRRIGWRALHREPKKSLLLYNFFVLFTIACLLDIDSDITSYENTPLFSNFFTLLAILSIVNLETTQCTCQRFIPKPDLTHAPTHKTTRFRSLYWIFSLFLCVLLFVGSKKSYGNGNYFNHYHHPTPKRRGPKRKYSASFYTPKNKKIRRDAYALQYRNSNSNSINSKQREKRNKNHPKSVNKDANNVYHKKWVPGDFSIDKPWSEYKCEVPYYNVGKDDRICEYCHAKFWHDQRNSKKTSQRDRFGAQCCNYGKRQVPIPKPPPRYLNHLFHSQSKEAKFFRENIRAFNCKFSWASIKSNFKPTAYTGRKYYCYKAEGQLYHHYGPMANNSDEIPKGLQIYMHDNNDQIKYRSNLLKLDKKKLGNKIIKKVQKEILEYNAWINEFQLFYEENKDEIDFVSVIINSDPSIQKGVHKSQYNKGSNTDQVCGLLKRNTNENYEVEHKEIELRLKGGGLKNVNEEHCMCDPASYPLLLPYGDIGWSSNNAQGLTCLQWYRYLLHERDDAPNVLFRSGKLFQQWLVDQYCKMDQIRLNSCRTKTAQRKYRKYYCKDLEKAKKEGKDINDIGYRTILPSSYRGGPRFMNQLKHDALAIVRHFKKAHYFITMTMNPDCDEVLEKLKGTGQKPYERPDVVTKIWEQKKQFLLHLILEKGILGKTVADVWSQEYQREGLPHIHLIIILDESDAPKHMSDYDKFISAQIPNKNTDPELYELVTKLMVHNNCENDKSRSCIDSNGCCTKRFPKDYCPQTRHLKNSYPEYQRLNMDQGGYIHHKEFSVVTNQWIVPYNPGLLKALKCHVNVECVTGIGCIKYIFKYILKGTERASVILKQHKPSNKQNPNSNNANKNSTNDSEKPINEVQQVLDCRRVCSYECASKLLGHPQYHIFPKVTRLDCYIPGNEMIYWDENDPSQIDDAIEKRQKDKLTEFFRNNAKERKHRLSTNQRTLNGVVGPHGFELLYHQYPEYYSWNKKLNEWKRREGNEPAKNKTIGRIYLTKITERKRHFLRLLLLTVPGPTSWDDLKTVRKNKRKYKYKTYIAACRALGLLEHDKECYRCLEEVSHFHSAKQMRNLFVTLLRQCQPADPPKLFDKFKNELSEDIYNARKFPYYDEHKHKSDFVELDNNGMEMRKIWDTALLKIHQELEIYGESIVDYDFKVPEVENCLLQTDICTEIRQERRYNQIECAEYYKEWEDKFAHQPEQNKIWKEIKHSLDNNSTGFGYHINGIGGSGKSKLGNCALSYVRSKGNIALSVASTGIAATLLFGGRTFHSRFNCPLHINELGSQVEFFQIAKESGLAKLLRETKLIIFDEFTTLSKYSIECLDRTLRFLLDSDKFMGGILVILMGDFRQCLPIIKFASAADIINACANHSEIWPRFETQTLTKNLRLNADDIICNTYAQQILDIGNGVYPTENTIAPNMIHIPDNWISQTNNLSDFISECYQDIETNYINPEYWADQAILTPLNEDVAAINNMILNLIPGKLYEGGSLMSTDSLIDVSSADGDFDIQELWETNAGGLPPHDLKLKVGVPVMLLRNIAPHRGLCNGTRMIVKEIFDNVIVVKILTGKNAGATEYIHRIYFDSDDQDLFLPFRRKQFPIKLAFCMTINKSQGQSLERVSIYLPNPVFGHGQLYTALSRVRDPQKLNILIVNTNEHGFFPNLNGWYTRNIVYQQALRGLFDKNQESVGEYDDDEDFAFDFEIDPMMYYL